MSICVAGLLCLGAVTTSNGENYIKTWTIDYGLPSIRIRDLIEYSQNKLNLSNDLANGLFADSDDNIWIGHNLQIRATDNSSGISSPPIEVAIAVEPIFLESNWFILIVSFAISLFSAGIIILVFKIKHQKTLAIEDQKRAIEADRHRIAYDIHDQLGSDLTYLSCIIYSIESHQHSFSKQYLEDIDNIRNTIDKMADDCDQIIWSINPQNDTLESLVSHIGQLTHKHSNRTGIPCRLKLPSDSVALNAKPRLRHQISLIIQEALTNIAKHSNASESSLELRIDNSDIQIIIRDNGVGFEQQINESPHHTAEEGGLGLHSMKKRAESINGRFRCTSSPGSGTTIDLRIPQH